jgi:hypothetical protein
MRNLRLFKFAFVAVAVILAISSCSEKKKDGPVVSGIDAEILNLADSTIKLYSVVSPLDQVKGKSPEFEMSVTVDSNGIFARPIEVKEGYYIFEYDQNRVLYFIQVGKKLSLDFDATKPYEKPDYSGKLKYESRYLYDRHLAQSNFIANKNKYYEYNEEAFVEIVELMRGKMDTALVMYIANHPTGSPDFMQQESLTNLYFMASYLEAYPLNRGTDVELKSSYYVSDKGLNVNDTNAMNNSEFYEFIRNYVWRRAGAPTNKQNVIAQLAFEDRMFTVIEYKDYLRFKAAKEVAKWEPGEDRKMVLDTLLSSIVDPEIQAYLAKSIQSDTASIPLFENVILEDQ